MYSLKKSVACNDPLSSTLWANELWAPFLSTARNTNTFSARFDVKEDADAIYLKADLPGIQEENISISLEGNKLKISGERTAEEKKACETYYLYERRAGSFHRTFRLPSHANGEAVEASLKDGVLSLTIPKKSEAKAKNISIQKE